MFNAIRVWLSPPKAETPKPVLRPWTPTMPKADVRGRPFRSGR